jgi:S-adenosylmethionine uptake transporter
MVASALLFASMGVCVKLASGRMGTAEVVLLRGLLGALFTWVLARTQGVDLRTAVPQLHLRRGLTGGVALALWFTALGGLPVATAMTLNYLSSIWMAVFLVGMAWTGRHGPVSRRLLGAVVLGFGGVVLVLRPSFEQQQWWPALAGLVSGMAAAAAYRQIMALGRAGEPQARVVFYFSLIGASVGLVWLPFTADRWVWPDAQGWALLIGVAGFATAAQLFLTHAYAVGKTLVNASLHYLGIAFAFLYGVTLFDDPVIASSLLGMGLIAAAGLMAVGAGGR